MGKKDFEDIKFENDSEMIKYLSETTNKFDILDFYNSGEDVSGLIVITPNQTIEIHPLGFHQFAANKIYNLLYGIDYNEKAKTKTNNILIRLVCGSSYQFYSIVPKKVTTYQAEKYSELINLLKNYKRDIKFPDPEGYSEMLFYETYMDSVEKLNNLKINDDISELIPDKYDIENMTRGKKI